MTHYRTNEQKNGVEILFDAKPDTVTLDALKAAGFRWNRGGGYWYAVKTAERLELAAKIADGCKVAPAAIEGKPVRAAKAPAVDREMLRKEYSKIWNTKKMVDYCVNKVAEVAEVAGGIVTIDKHSIETRFCFGEGSNGVSYEEAGEMAEHARTSCDYLKKENMQYFNRVVEALEQQAHGLNVPDRIAVIADTIYYNEPDGFKLRGVRWVDLWEVIEACGGQAHIDELPGQHFNIGGAIHIPEAWELQNITEAYKRARAAHEKKVDAYIKRYGTSKVHAWTFWVDA